MTSAADIPVRRDPSSSGMPWMAVGWFAALIALCYWPVMVRLIAQWNNDEDMGHGFFVPILAAYIAWQKRDEFLAPTAQGRTGWVCFWSSTRACNFVSPLWEPSFSWRGPRLCCPSSAPCFFWAGPSGCV